MAALVVDTSVWVELLRGRDLPDLELAVREGLVVLPPLVVAELLSASLAARDRAPLVEFLRDLPLHPTPFAHWERVGLLRSALAGRGVAASVPDVHVAQCALEARARLWSLDAVFGRIAAVAPLRLVRP